jgi:lipopolysaccharide export system protein LptC
VLHNPLEGDAMQDDNFQDDNRLNALSSANRERKVNHGYTKLIRTLRIILPLIAVGMTVVVLTWEKAGQHIAPMAKEDVAPQAPNIQNELLKPVFNSIDEQGRPFSVTAQTATQDRINPDILNLEKPTAEVTMSETVKINVESSRGIYQQKAQKLNLDGAVHLIHSDGYTLSSEELRVDLLTQKAFSGLDVHVEGPAGTIDSTGLEGDTETGILIFTGPAKVILNSGNMKLSP